MYKYILESAGDINWMAILALCTFVFIFVTAIILIFKRDQAFVQHMSRLPLEDTHSEPEKNTAI